MPIGYDSVDGLGIVEENGRLQLLIQLYEAAIESMSAALELAQAGQSEPMAPHLIRAQRIVLEILDGLDLKHGDVPHHVQYLCEYLLHVVASPDVAGLESAVSVLSTLHSGFVAIEDEVIDLQLQGEIPGEAQRQVLDTTA